MTTTTRAPAGTRCYFATWTGHSPPIQPRDPIDYVEAEASRAFSVFVFDAHGRPVLFEKWWARAAQADPSALADRALPAEKVFFAPDPADEDRPGGAVPVDETREMAAYFRAHVHPDGTVAALEHVRRKRMVHHEYRYWEDGQLREFRFHGERERGVEEFDRDGRRVRSVVEGSEE